MTSWTPLKFLQYAMGHVLNDMCASSWFSYLLVFLHHAVGMTPTQSAVVMFSGQLADGLATPLVGVYSDDSEGFRGFGRRKSWLVGGALLVIVCYYAVFGVCWLDWFWTPTEEQLVIYYSIGAAIFNIGWATVQVSHMALVRKNLRALTK